MVRTSFLWSLTGICLLGMTAWADDSDLPAGDSAESVANAIQRELFKNGVGGIDVFEKQQTAFYKKFATDPGRWHLKLLQVRILQQTGEKLGGGGLTSKEILQQINSAKDIPDDLKEDVSALNVQVQARDLVAGKSKLASVTEAFEKHVTHYPDGKHENALLNILVDSAAESEDAERNLVALSESKRSDIAERATAKLKWVRVRQELISKPLELSFQAVDGREVDLAKLRGKVVLVDFWATWCPPCMREMPKVVATYKKLKDKGFEVVGISLDSDKDKLKEVIADKEMSWPNCFEGKGWENSFAQKYGVNAIPEVWLVDKKGMVKIFNREQELAEEVEKLLAQ
ncbi:TlpA family protein disulfide reductase [Anatilimnocola floriformis]|uniref:TlpA family protein disulfide reductase n=1 Tax=Anatilimnocola floriformis TaxID=2948575 RepID=UPI0020C3DD31|nr:TlpA disulfide reductase family protein [Anatilimnocola floriformis]